jgi:glycosyltransferase involved in cell wall biosynthesis
MDISIIIPAYNEESRIGKTLSAYAAVFAPKCNDRWELLVVLNGCNDGTEDVVLAAGRDCPAIRPIVFKEKLGKGGAILQGLSAATGDSVAFVDADNMVGPEETMKLLDALGTDDVAIGWRRPDLTLATERQPRIRRMVSLALPLWARLFLRLPFHDPQCGAKAMRKDASVAMLPLLQEQGWALDLAMLMAARDLGLSVAEVPVAWLHVAEGSKIQLRQASWEVFVATWRLKFKRRRPTEREPG